MRCPLASTGQARPGDRRSRCRQAIFEQIIYQGANYLPGILLPELLAPIQQIIYQVFCCLNCLQPFNKIPNKIPGKKF